MATRAGFTDKQRDEFRRRIRLFMESQDDADPAEAMLARTHSPEAIQFTGLFHDGLMLFAVKSPKDFKEQVVGVIGDGYAGAYLTVRYLTAGTLPMRFKVTCALTSTSPDIAGWVALALIREAGLAIK